MGYNFQIGGQFPHRLRQRRTRFCVRRTRRPRPTRAGTALGAVSGAQNQNPKLGAFKSAFPLYPGYKKASVFVLMTPDNIAIVLGETKVSWILEHDIRSLIENFEKGLSEEGFRRILGQTAKYMLEMGLAAFLTTY